MLNKYSMRHFFIALLLCLIPTTTFSGFPYDRRSKNIAVLFTMTNENGRTANLNMMESVLNDGKLGFQEVQRRHNVSSPQIYEALTEASKKAGRYGTLLVYFNSHGGGSGERFGMSARGGSFKPSKAMAAIAKGGKKKRVIVLIDTCHASGGIQEGFQGNETPINPQTGLPEIKEWKCAAYDAYEECLVIASSSAADLSIRGAFASRLKKAYSQARDGVTVAEFMKIFAAQHSNTRQKPHYKVMPNDQMLDEPLFQNALIREIPIVSRNGPRVEFPPDYIPTPRH
jgi:hypothetical protein